ncbi:lipopolysaccharide biosynthesis protein [Pseudomonas sp. Z1-12]|uniref:lipopolysaccharide biosynthesis protein n=1 Tax=Pseudomonas sp. Z1-12 TaxID=2817408 RepID=UPI003DA9BC56
MKTKAISTANEKSRSGFFWLLLGTAGQNAVQLISILILARILTPAEFGVVGIGAAIIAFLRIFSEVGVGPALVQKEEISSVDIKTANSMSLLLGVILAISLYFLAESFSLFFSMPELTEVLRTLALMLPVISYSVVGQSLLQRRFEFKKLSSVTFSSYLVAYGGVSVYMALHGYGMWSLVAAFWIQSIIFLILILILCRDAAKVGFSYPSAKGMLDFGVGYSMARLCNYAAGQGDNLVVGKLLGAESVGLYGRAYQIMSMPAILFGSVVDKVFFPLMAKMQNNNEALERLYLSSIYFSLLIFVYLSGYIYIFSDQLIGALFGDGWGEVAKLIEVMSIGLYFRIGYKFSDCLTMAVGKVYARAGIQFLYALSVVVLVVLGSGWGLIGASIGVVVAIVLNYLMMMMLVWRILNFNVGVVFLRHLKVLGLFSISLLIFLFLNRLIDIASPLLGFVVSSLIYVASFGVVLVVFARYLKDELGVLKLVAKR